MPPNTNINLPTVTRAVGLHGAAKAWAVSTLLSDYPQVLVVCKNRKVAEEFEHDLRFLISDRSIFNYPSWETIPFENVSPTLDISANRLAILSSLTEKTSSIVVTSCDAILQRVLPPEVVKELSSSIRVGDEISAKEFSQKLEAMGYQSVSIVESIGEMVAHGAVVDLYPALLSNPIRVEFRDNLIFRIALFDPDTQRSLDDLSNLKIPPVKEFPAFKIIPNPEELEGCLERLKERGRELETPPREIASAMAALRSGVFFPGIELHAPFAVPKLASILDYLLESALVVLDDELAVQQSLDQSYDNVTSRSKRLESEHRLIPTPESLYLSPAYCEQLFSKHSRYYLDHLQLSELDVDSHESLIKRQVRANTELTTRLQSAVGSGQALQPLANFINSLRKSDFSIAFIVGSRPRSEKLQRHLLDLGFDVPILEYSGSQWIERKSRIPIAILHGHLSAGFQLISQKLAFISENEVFSERSYRRSGKTRISLKRLMGSLAQLKEGDYVVHSDFGVGLYHGLKHLEVEGAESDFLQIEYADSKLFLPVHNIGKVQKYNALEGQSPTLDKLSSTRWAKTKQKVRQAVATLAGDLIKLYATRDVMKGWQFDPAGSEDERFAEDFPFNETPDQLDAINDTIKDMTSERPMDRLVCGDVGFGKTEVAMRAAFKCLQHTKQVAILVPTTILAEQHKQSFVKRFGNFQAKVGAISRFYRPQQNKETLAELASGELDIVVGTHRILSKDVIFKDLGLLVVDEEHRFGVQQKEKIKAWKKQVDVLTLTATPIPRTLHMTLLGIRDISVISTPPHDRRLIRTYTAAYDESLVRDAIMRELQRGGQCFYVHNRVQTIDSTTAQLHTLVPEARFGFAHGQMSEVQLEKIMKQFLEKELDVLVCTSIIESGLDIPNANTMLIERADTFGLAPLYQLRGRVGRSDRQAYCYFLIPKSRKLGIEAQKRLKALQSLDDLGMGFNLAVRDLEIRGAGNLLGKEQSGNVQSVGYELYSKILKEAILNLKGEELPISEAIDPDIKLGISAYIPDFYIPDISERLVMYQRLAGVDSGLELDQIVDEMQDRFGPLGPEVTALAELMRIRALLRQFGIVKAEVKGSRLLLSFSPIAPIDPQKFIKLVEQDKEQYKFSKQLVLSVECRPKVLESPEKIFRYLDKFLPSLHRDNSDKEAECEAPPLSQ